LAQRLYTIYYIIHKTINATINTPRNEEALSNKEFREKVENSIPCGHIGKAEDISPAVLLLCSNEGRYITGSEIIIDGGMRL
jgi:NAD(P)-dependent dehydrogenase (short-subunit alcohol dehydrogenase family)